MSPRVQVPELHTPDGEDYGGDDVDSAGHRQLSSYAVGSTVDPRNQSRFADEPTSSVTTEQDARGLGLTDMELRVVAEYAEGFHSDP